MNQKEALEDFYRDYINASRAYRQEHRQANGLTLISTILLGYVVFWGLWALGLSPINIWEVLRSYLQSMLAQLGVLRQFKRLRAASVGRAGQHSTLQSVLAPLQGQALGSILGGNPNTLPGLGNWDNSCYQNSVIQGLASLKTVRAHLEDVTAIDSKITSDSTNGVLLETMQQLNDERNAGKVLWMPSRLKSMSSMQQQDAQEYFSKIMEEAEKELAIVSRGQPELPGFVPVETRVSFGEDADSLVSESPFQGHLAQRVACMQCGYSDGLSLIPFNCLTVPLGRGWEYDVRDCLDEYTNLEAIEGVECAKCTLLKTKAQLEALIARFTASQPTNEGLATSAMVRLQSVNDALETDNLSDATLISSCQIPKKNWATSTKSRQAIIAKAPKALAIHVNRSVFDELTGAQSKNPAAVSFPLLLDLRYWCLGRSACLDVPESGTGPAEVWPMDPKESMIAGDDLNFSVPGPRYELRAVVTHYGRHENGHYICYRKQPCLPKSKEETWWRLSDEDVREVSESYVLGQSGVFMLFYEMVNNPPAINEEELLQLAISIPLPPEVETDAPDKTFADGVSVNAHNSGQSSKPDMESEVMNRDAVGSLTQERADFMDELRVSLSARRLTPLPAASGIGSAEDSGDDNPKEHVRSPGLKEGTTLERAVVFDESTSAWQTSPAKLRTARKQSSSFNDRSITRSMRVARAF